MQKPPFRRAGSTPGLVDLHRAAGRPPAPMSGVGAVDPGRPAGSPPALTGTEPTAEPGRQRFGVLDAHLHCSVIGTCLSTGDLRKAMAKFIVVDDASDLDVHHEAVRLARRPDVAQALNRLLDRRHDAVVQRFARVREPAALATLWQDAIRSGEVPGAYWAVLSHRRVTPELRQQVFGDVHMLSHLVGAANRADIRRLVAIEHENAGLQQRNLRQQARIDALAHERDDSVAEAARLRARVDDLEQGRNRDEALGAAADANERASVAAVIAIQTGRREAAESKVQALEDEAGRLGLELARARDQLATFARELAVAEAELRRLAESAEAEAPVASALAGRRLLYVGGRPSSSAAIRDYVLRQRAEYQRHDGGIEDRKGLLGPAIGWADLVVFPVDCIDHDSALRLKRQCANHGKPFLPLRSASVASLAAALATLAAEGGALAPPPSSPSTASRRD